MTEQGLVIYQGGQMSVTDLRTLAGDFAKSGYFADAKDAFQAVVKIQAGLELGFGPVYSMTKIYIVKGKVTVSAEALGAMVKRSGRYDYQVKKLDDSECALEFTDHDKMVYVSKFTMEDAKRAELVKQDSGWLKWPRAMLMSKALSQGARIVCPHVIAGIYTPEDFGIETDAEGVPKVTANVESPPTVEMITEGQELIKTIEALPVVPQADTTTKVATPIVVKPTITRDYIISQVILNKSFARPETALAYLKSQYHVTEERLDKEPEKVWEEVKTKERWRD